MPRSALPEIQPGGQVERQALDQRALRSRLRLLELASAERVVRCPDGQPSWASGCRHPGQALAALAGWGRVTDREQPCPGRLQPTNPLAHESRPGQYFLVMSEQLPDRNFGWSNMFVGTRESDPREQGDPPVGERDTLARFLRDYRLTLELRCEGLDAAAMAAQSVPPSDLSLLGLVRHLAGVEHFWFRQVLAGQGVSRLYRSADGRNEAFAFAEQFLAAQQDLGATVSFDNSLGEQDSISVREALVSYAANGGFGGSPHQVRRKAAARSQPPASGPSGWLSAACMMSVILSSATASTSSGVACRFER